MKPYTIVNKITRKKAMGPISRENVEEIADWCRGTAAGSIVFVTTLEGLMRADEGDWIIQGVKGEFYPCKPDVFDASYEFVDREPSA